MPPTITPQEFRDRLNALGYVTQTQAAAALGTKQYNVNRWLTGARPIPRGAVRTLELLERDPIPVLTYAMATALGEALKPGDPVPVPETGTELQLRTIDWPRTFEAMRALALVEGDEPTITERGVRALKRYLTQEEEG